MKKILILDKDTYIELLEVLRFLIDNVSKTYSTRGMRLKAENLLKRCINYSERDHNITLSNLKLLFNEKKDY